MATGADFCSEDLGPVQVLVFRLFCQGASGDAGSPLFIRGFIFRAGEEGGREEDRRELVSTAVESRSRVPSPADVLVVPAPGGA